MFNDMCDKCKTRKAVVYHSYSSSKPTIKLCKKCDTVYERFMKEAEQKFFSEEIQVDNFQEGNDYCQISEIKKGDTVKCLRCGSDIKLDNETFIFDADAEYIYCPHCKLKIDVQAYHLSNLFCFRR